MAVRLLSESETETNLRIRFLLVGDTALLVSCKFIVYILFFEDK
jgi:hypothetical protein